MLNKLLIWLIAQRINKANGYTCRIIYYESRPRTIYLLIKDVAIFCKTTKCVLLLIYSKMQSYDII